MALPKLECIDDTTCKYCLKSYSTNSNLNKHQKKCKSKIDIELKEELFQLLKLEINKNNKDLEKQNLFLKLQINNLQKELNSDITTNITTNHNYTSISNTNCNNKTINILAYEKTDLSHLTDKDFESIMKKCYKSVPTLIEKTHFNPLKPENKNIYISNIKQNFIMKYNGGKWILSNKDETLDDLYENSSNILEDKVNDLHNRVMMIFARQSTIIGMLENMHTEHAKLTNNQQHTIKNIESHVQQLHKMQEKIVTDLQNGGIIGI